MGNSRSESDQAVDADIYYVAAEGTLKVWIRTLVLVAVARRRPRPHFVERKADQEPAIRPYDLLTLWSQVLKMSSSGRWLFAGSPGASDKLREAAVYNGTCVHRSCSNAPNVLSDVLSDVLLFRRAHGGGLIRMAVRELPTGAPIVSAGERPR